MPEQEFQTCKWTCPNCGHRYTVYADKVHYPIQCAAWCGFIDTGEPAVSPERIAEIQMEMKQAADNVLSQILAEIK